MKKIHESGENYLETILILSESKPVVRSIDIATELNYSKPSVSRAISILRSNGCVNVGDGGELTLTEAGRAIAEQMYKRHKLLTDALISLGVDEETAVNDACRIEHVISEASFKAIENIIKRESR